MLLLKLGCGLLLGLDAMGTMVSVDVVVGVEGDLAGKAVQFIL